ncbi:MAG TPA: threonine--tRNA ligase [Candidatus Saccharimonadales bacterium]
MSANEITQVEKIRHSLAHLLAATVTEMYPGAKNAIGPAIENGFYQDFETPSPITEDDLPKIEASMREKLKSWAEFVRKEVTPEEARKEFARNPYKLELINEFSNDTSKKITFYTSGSFIDLCRGGHVNDAKEINPHSFRLTKVSGAYWRGDQNKQQLQRIYGLAFETAEELEHYLEKLEETKKRDHRKLGEDLKLFFISESVGAGLPLLLPRGEAIKNQLMKYMRAKEEARGYQYVATPVLTQSALYERSGHASYYFENMYGTHPDEEGNVFYLKPMNCPHHHMIFEKLVESYRDLPLRLSEHAGLYRYELSGTLTGLIRMRGPITQNDSHIYVSPEQVEAEFSNVLQLFEEVYREIGVKDYWFRLSLPDFSKEKYAGTKEQWEWAGGVIRRCLQASDLPFVEGLDEAAFYGPKVDVQIKNVLGKEDSIATVQLDIVVPERMKLTYVDSEGNKQYPLVIHKSIMGAFERFMAFILEQTAGKLPLWLSPEQIRFITVNQEAETTAYAQLLLEKAEELDIRTVVDNSNESVGKKIRTAELMKVPYTVVIGQKEIEKGELSPRIRKDLVVEGRNEQSYGVDQFLQSIANEMHSRVSKSSL